MTIIGKIRALSLKSEIQRRLEYYSQPYSQEERENIQLNRFNKIWKDIYLFVPYYHEKIERGILPKEFTSWVQFHEMMPINNRQTCKSNIIEMTSIQKKPDYHRITSGTTGEPLRLPSWYSENQITRPDMWVGRAWNNIKPEDTCFYFWGQSTKFDASINGKINTFKRKIKDRLLGYHREVVYDMTDDAFKRAADDLINYRPRYIIGYATAIEVFADINKERALDFSKLNIKGVIATSEIFNSLSGSKIIEETFNCPVIMEYGSIEMDVVAYTNRSDNFCAFWNNYYLEVVNSEKSGKGELLITSLYPRSFPLIRYSIGDEIELFEQDINKSDGISRFRKVLGRTRDYIELPNGHHIHPQLFQAILVDFPDQITRFQIISMKTGIRIDILSPQTSLSEFVINEIHRRFSLIHPDLSNLEINVVEKLHQNISGKTPIQWREN
jgi:phenylacetate-CoA ligase